MIENNDLESNLSIRKVGADMPYDTYNADDKDESKVRTNGTVIGPKTTWTTQEAEASGRRAVRLDNEGDFVEITLQRPASGLVVRFCIPDAEDGNGIDAEISLYINERQYSDVMLTSRYSWMYGEYHSHKETDTKKVRWSKNPKLGNPHKYYDEVRVKLDKEYPAGTILKLQRDKDDYNFFIAKYVIIDFIETEIIPNALNMPEDFLSIAEFGANSQVDCMEAMKNCIQAVYNSNGRYKGLWVPEGEFNFNIGNRGAGDIEGTRIFLDKGIVIKGAGIWHSILKGDFASIYLRNGNCHISDFSIIGNEVIRDDYNGIAGVEGIGTNTLIENIWIEHTKVGFWFSDRTDGVHIKGCRIRNVWADGINLHRGTSNSIVEHCNFRNSGDDCMAMWSDTYIDVNNTYQNNTIQVPCLANGIAIYGGRDIKLLNNLICDTVDNGAGISFGTDFNPPEISGTFLIKGNKLLRCGSYQHDFHFEVGALWSLWKFSAKKEAQIIIEDNSIEDSVYSALFISCDNNDSIGADLVYSYNNIRNPGTHAVHISRSAVGSAKFINNKVDNLRIEAFKNEGKFKVDNINNDWK